MTKRKFYAIGETRPSQILRRSRNERKCDFCNEKINRGDKWRKCGSAKTLTICEACNG